MTRADAILDLIIVAWMSLVPIVLIGCAWAVSHPKALPWSFALALTGCAGIGLYWVFTLLAASSG